jgi:hypothetical protein
MKAALRLMTTPTEVQMAVLEDENDEPVKPARLA